MITFYCPSFSGTRKREVHVDQEGSDDVGSSYCFEGKKKKLNIISRNLQRILEQRGHSSHDNVYLGILIEQFGNGKVDLKGSAPFY